MVVVGFGCVGQGMLPLLLRHIGIQPGQIMIITADEDGSKIAREYGISFAVSPLTRDNYVGLLDGMMKAGDFLLNLSVDVSSIALIEWCQRKGVLYLDASIEPWAGGYVDIAIPPALRSNYVLREAALTLRRQYPHGPTAIVTQGANPGLVSPFVKAALLNIAADTGLPCDTPAKREDWARLACALGVKVIHVSERDSQVSQLPKLPGEFVNTWSAEGFVGEGCQPAELGWGSHERHWPPDGKHYGFGSDCAIYLNRPGAATRVRTWTPRAGSFHGFLITHGESVSIADYLSLREGGETRYRPTVHYAYHPCDEALLSLHELAGRQWQMQPRVRLLRDEIVDGMDELGVLLMGHARGAYWYGSQLTIQEARQLAPHNNATSLQVAAGVLAGVVWALENPSAGIIEPDELDYQRILDIALPYLGRVVGVYSDWTPLAGRNGLFEEDVDASDPWQFKNFRVA